MGIPFFGCEFDWGIDQLTASGFLWFDDWLRISAALRPDSREVGW